MDDGGMPWALLLLDRLTPFAAMSRPLFYKEGVCFDMERIPMSRPLDHHGVQ